MSGMRVAESGCESVPDACGRAARLLRLLSDCCRGRRCMDSSSSGALHCNQEP